MAIIKLPTIYGKGESGLDQQLKIAQGDLMQSKKGLNAVQTALMAAKAGDAIVESKPLNMFVDEVKLRGGQLADWMSGEEQPEHTGKAALDRMKDPKASPGTVGGGATKQEAVRSYTGAMEAKEQMMAEARRQRPPEPEKTMTQKALAALGYAKKEGARINQERTAAGTREQTPAQVARDERAAYFTGLVTTPDTGFEGAYLSDYAGEAVIANADPDALAVMRSLGITLPQLIERVDQPLEKYGSSEGSIDLLESIVPGVRRRMEMGASAKEAVGHLSAQRYQARAQKDGAHHRNEMLLGSADDMKQLGGYVVENLKKGFMSLLGDEVLAGDAVRVIEQTGVAPTAEQLGRVRANQVLPPLDGPAPAPEAILRDGAASGSRSQVTFDTNVPTDRGVGDTGAVLGDMVGRADRVVQGQKIKLPKSAETRTAEVLSIADRLQQQEYMQFPSPDQLEQYTVNQLIGIASSTPLSNEEFAILDYLVSDKAKSKGLSNLFGAKYITEARDLLGKARTGFLSERRESKRLEMARALAKIEKDLGAATRDSTGAQTDWIDATVGAELTQAKSANEWLKYMANSKNKRSLMNIRLNGGSNPAVAKGLLAGFRYDMPSNSMKLAPAVFDGLGNEIEPAQTRTNGQIMQEMTSLAAGTGARAKAAANAMNAVAKQFTQQADAASTAKLVELNDQRLQKIRGDIARAKRDASLRAKIAPLEAKLTSLIEERGNVSKRLLRIPMSDWVEGTVGKKLSAKETAYQGKINKLRREIAKVVSGGTASRTGDSTGQTGDGEQDVPEEQQASADDF